MEAPIAYIAGIGMITPIGVDAQMTLAAVDAGINQFEVSDYDTGSGESITMSGVPEAIFEDFEFEIDEGEYYSELFDRIIKMAIIAAREACAGQAIDGEIPLILAIPEPVTGIQNISSKMLGANLARQAELPIDAGRLHALDTGRAAGIEALDLASRYLNDQGQDFVLIGGSDSYWHLPLIQHLDTDARVLAPGVMNGFVPGEGAGFLLLTGHPDKALVQDGQVIGLHAPGIAREQGHMYSETPYFGDGLSLAFRQALNGGSDTVSAIYSSLNGEQFWAKEYGVAVLRNQERFIEQLQLQHPADCYGDLGVASGPVLIGIAALRQLQQSGAVVDLVYCSSDTAARAALRVEKQPFKQKV